MKKRTAVTSGLALALLVAAAPAAADTHAGVEAWLRGDYRKAVDEWRPAALKGEADAQYNLGQAYKLGRGVPVDMAQAEQWYRKAALQGHPEAETQYGFALYTNGKLADAVPWLEKAAARGEPRAELVLGTMLFNGDGGLKKDWVRAYALMQRASATLPQAAQTLAQMDQFVPEQDRARGIAMARELEANAQRPELPSEVTGGPAGAVRRAELPASVAATELQPHVRAPAKPPHGAPAAEGRWRIQLGAFRDQGNAQRLWDSLKGRVAALSSLQPSFVKTGAITKLQVGPLASSAEAARACAAVRPTGTACVPVAP